MTSKDVTCEILEAWIREIDPEHDKRWEEFRDLRVQGTPTDWFLKGKKIGAPITVRRPPKRG